MSQVGVHCVRGDMPHQECRACALNPLHPCAWTPDMLEKLRRTGWKEPTFSPTRILGCQRREVLQREVDYYTDIDDAYPMFRGRMVHSLMEDSRYPGALGVMREQQFHTMVDTSFGPQEFEGTVDVIVVKDMVLPAKVTCKITDYKSKSQVGHDLTAALSSHVAQVNIYRWMVTRELPKLLGYPCEVEVDELEIEYAGYNKPRRFTSAGPLKAQGKQIRANGTRGPVVGHEELTLKPIPIWRLDKVEAGVRRRIEQRLALQEAETLPDVLPEAEQWMCERCPVNAVCWARHAGGE